jgi:hypothetical protein
METIRRLLWGKEDSGESNQETDLELPRPVEKAYVLSKDGGHRGPVIGGYLTSGFDEIQIACTVTPSAVTIVKGDAGIVLSTFVPDQGDAFTASCLIPLSSRESENQRLCGMALGTQRGFVVVVELGSSVREIARCEASTSSVTVLTLVNTSTIIVGNVSGQLRVYDPIRHPDTPSASLQISDASVAVTAVAQVSEQSLWVAIGTMGIRDVRIVLDPALGVVSLENSSRSDFIQFEGMQAITSIVFSKVYGLAICLSSCSDVFLISIASYELVHRYPASLMTCGAPLSVMSSADTEESTYLFLGGMDGSLSTRELSKRDKDGKLQCILHRCIDRLTPQAKGSGLSGSLSPSDGCPISSLWVSESMEHCVVGDASCALFIVPLALKRHSRASSATVDEPIPLNVDDESTTKEGSDSVIEAEEPLPDNVQDIIEKPNEIEKSPKPTDETPPPNVNDESATKEESDSVIQAEKPLSDNVQDIIEKPNEIEESPKPTEESPASNVDDESATQKHSDPVVETEEPLPETVQEMIESGSPNPTEESPPPETEAENVTAPEGKKKPNRSRRPKNRQKKQ